LWNQGALEGRTRADAFEVHCDETTMTNADIDAGRVICRIGFTAAYPIERIVVSLLLLQPTAQRAKEAA
jgi:phage tail sheath protein FI